MGEAPALARDGQRVLAEVWKTKGVEVAPDVASYGERYDRATTWIVAYHRGSPVGVMGLLDMRVASVALDYGNLLAPPHLDLDTTREIGRVAIVPGHRGGRQTLMLALVFAMYELALRLRLETLFCGSTRALFAMYLRFNPTGRLVAAPPAGSEDATRARYFAPLRKVGGEGVIYTFSVMGASPWDVFVRFVTGRLRAHSGRDGGGARRAWGLGRSPQRDSTHD